MTILVCMLCIIGVTARLASAQQEKKNEIPDGWALSPASSHNVLAGITIYDGPPEGNASLVYDKQSRKKHMLFLTWTLDGDSKKAFWIVCRYAGTTIQLKRQLPAGIKALRVTFDDLVKTEGEPTVEKIEYL